MGWLLELRLPPLSPGCRPRLAAGRGPLRARAYAHIRAHRTVPCMTAPFHCSRAHADHDAEKVPLWGEGPLAGEISDSASFCRMRTARCGLGGGQKSRREEPKVVAVALRLPAGRRRGTPTGLLRKQDWRSARGLPCFSGSKLGELTKQRRTCNIAQLSFQTG